MTRQKANSLENIPWSELGKRNIPAKKVYFSWVLRVPREIEDNGYHAKFFRGGGGGGVGCKQSALSGLGEIFNCPFVELLSYIIPVSQVSKLKLYT